MHDFLTTYNAYVHAIRVWLPFLPLPTFTFAVWLTGLVAGILLLLVLPRPPFEVIERCA